jgi:hypothetical protein
MMRRGTDRGSRQTAAMQARWGRLALRWGAMVIMLAMCAVVPAGAAPGAAGAPLRVELAALGYQTLSPEFLLAGSSMLTVDFVDKDHLLITFNVRRLMKREVNDPVDDADRTVGAFLVELPSGKALARTEWRMHDRGQYLWNLGHGRFLLRVRDRLTMFAPMTSADPTEAFREVPLVQMDRHIVAVFVSSESDLLTVETTKWAMGGQPGAGFSADPAPVQISFYRLNNSADGLAVISAGTIRTRTAVLLPLTTAGRLDVLDGGKTHWLFNFNEYAGKVDELAEFDTSCFPRPTFVGHAEFVVFGCRGAPDKVDMAGFNMKGEEMWQQNFYDMHVNPTFSFAPAAGRFALGRTIVNTDADPEIELQASMVTAQEVRVYQSYNGKVLFKTDCTPVERAGQNFSLSPDGLRLAVVRETLVQHRATKDSPAYSQNEAAVEIYALPALSAEDQAAVKDAKTHEPADTGARIDAALQRASAKSGKNAPAPEPGPPVDMGQDNGGAGGGTSPAVGQGAPAAPAADAQTGAATVGDTQSTGPRKPPTLYGPDEDHPQTPQTQNKPQ